VKRSSTKSAEELYKWLYVFVTTSIPRLLVLSFDFLIISLSNAANYLHSLILAVTK
jgi:hypothetical protein